jgi:hypothetical protein
MKSTEIKQINCFVGKLTIPKFFATANFKTKYSLLLIEEFLWFTAANVAPKTLTPTPCAPTAARPSTPSVNVTLEATENTTAKWKTNALACPMAA